MLSRNAAEYQPNDRNYDEQQRSERKKRVEGQSRSQAGGLMFGPPIDAIGQEQLEVAPTKTIKRFPVPSRTTSGRGNFSAARFKYLPSRVAARWQHALLECGFQPQFHCRSTLFLQRKRFKRHGC